MLEQQKCSLQYLRSSMTDVSTENVGVVKQVKIAGLYGHFDLVKLMVAVGGKFTEEDLAAILERGESNKEDIVRFLREEAPSLPVNAKNESTATPPLSTPTPDRGTVTTLTVAAAATGASTPMPAESSMSSAASGSPRIMFSYQWDNQPLIKRLAERVKQAGYNVWLDIEQMSGNTLEAMAGAVERSAAIIMCLSSKYQSSRNCRLEGEYAHLVSKPILPLMLTPWPWKPTNWLGLIIGAKLYFDFTNDAQFEAKLAEVLAELRRTVGPPPGSPSTTVSRAPPPPETADTTIATAASAASSSAMSSSTIPADATIESQWLLNTHNIVLRQPLDGVCLQELHKLQVRSIVCRIRCRCLDGFVHNLVYRRLR